MQTEAIQNGISAYKAGNKSMLLAAVMRFGKTHVAYSIAKGVGARFIVVASAKVDTKGEWRNGIYHSKFRNAVFVEFKDNYTVLVSDRMNDWYKHEVGLENFNIDMYIDEGRMLIVFASLQDLSGKKEKEISESIYYNSLQDLFEARVQKTKHNFIFKRENDLFIIDETHYGARAGIYGQAVKGEEQEDKEETEEQAQLNKYVKKIPTKCQLHLSGTPYQILASDEFNQANTEIIGRYSYTDMLEARDEWIKDNPNLPEEDSPYFGIPDIIRFGLKLTKECRRALNTQMKEQNSTNKLSYLFSCEPDDATKFHFEDAIVELAEAIFGGDKLCGFLNDDTIERGQIFNHIVGVMPSVKACHAFKKLLTEKNLLDKDREVIVAVDNSSTPKRDKCTETVQTLNNELERLDNTGKKSLTLTWGRFLTGASVPLWDSMIYLKDTENAQEYDQAIFRICTRHVGTGTTKDANGNEVKEKINLKPNVYLIDFKIDRMFNVIADAARNKSDVNQQRGLNSLSGHIAHDLTKIPLYVEWGKGKKMSQVQPQEFMKYYTDYNENSSIEDLVNRGFSKIKSCIDNPNIRALLTRFNSSSLHIEKTMSGIAGEGESSIELKQGTVDDEGTYVPDTTVKNKKKKDEFEGKLISFLKNILYCIICLDGEFNSLEDLINHLKNDADAETIAKDFLGEDCIVLLEYMNTNLDVISLNEIDAEIRNISTLLNDPNKTEIERVQTAVKKLGKLDKSEVVTPPEIAKKMIEKLDDSYYQNANTILEVNSKTGEFLAELYNKYGKDVAEKVKIVASSNITKQFIKRILALLDLPEYNLLDITVKDFIETKKLDNMKFDVILQNPPFDGDLHLQFFNKGLDLLSTDGKMCIVEPGQWLVQLKDNGKYTKQDSLSETIKEKIENHVVSVELNNLNKEFNISNKTVTSITTIDYSNEYETIELNRCGEIEQVNSIYDCNMIGNYSIVKSILNKCKAYKDHMIAHCINTKKYKEYEGKGYYFLRYGNYMIDNLGSNQRIFSKMTREYSNGLQFISYYTVAAEDKPIQSTVPLSKSGNPCDSVYGTKKELENWKYFVEHNKIVVFVNICLTIDEHNNSREYLPWLVNKKYTDDEVYNLLGITDEEQEIIDSTIERFDRNSEFAKNYFGV